MRTKLIILIALLVVILVPLAGCGGEDDTRTAEVQATAEGFMDALQAGDLTAVREYCDPSIFEEGGDLSSFGTIDNVGPQLAEAIGVDEEALGIQTMTDIQDFMDTLLENMVKSYTINDVTVDDNNIGTVKLTTTYGFNPNKIGDIDLDSEVETMATEYISEHQSELTDIYSNGGEEAMMVRILDDLMGDVLQKYSEQVMQTGEVTEDSIMTIEQVDGQWLVTSDKPVT